MNRSIISFLTLCIFIPGQSLAEEIRIWNRNNGTIVRLNSIKAITTGSLGDDYGRYLKWEYSVERSGKLTNWSVVGDCQSLSADWDDDREDERDREDVSERCDDCELLHCKLRFNHTFLGVSLKCATCRTVRTSSQNNKFSSLNSDFKNVLNASRPSG